MATRIRQVVVSFAVVAALFGLYRVTLVPLIEPAAAKTTPPVIPDIKPPSDRYREQLAPYFQPGDWELGLPKVIETDRAMLLLKEYRTLPDGRLHLEPCTVVLNPPARTGRAAASSGRPVVLRAPEGAVLQFDRPLDLRRAEIGRLVAGTLTGQVSITSEESRPGANDRLHLVSRNVQMNAQRLWTPHRVSLQLGNNSAVGSDLIVTFLPTSSATGAKRAQIGGVESIELVHVDHIRLDASAGVMLSDGDNGDDAAPEPAAPPSLEGDLPIEVTCAGPFVFDLIDRVATLEDRVDVVRPLRDGPGDQLTCEVLAIHFASAPDRADSQDADDNPSGDGEEEDAAPPPPNLSGMRAERIVATGHPVVVRSLSEGAFARGERLEYVVATRHITLDGDRGVLLQKDNQQVEARRIEYQPGIAGRLGQVWAAGPGRLAGSLDAERTGPVEAAWNGQLLLREWEGRHVASIEGNVRFDSAQLSGRTERLEVWLPPEMTDRGTHGTEQADGAAADQPGRAPGSPSLARTGTGLAQKFHVAGDMLRVVLIDREGKPAVEDVMIEGDARFAEVQTARAGEQPLVVAGRSLHLQRLATTGGLAVVEGEPATIDARGMNVAGSVIRLDRAANRIWIDGTGQMTLPTKGALAGGLLPSATNDRRDADPAAVARTATVAWKDGLDFDGQTVRIRGEVEVRSDGTWLGCPSVDVVLDRPVDFLNPDRQAKVDARQIVAGGLVRIENRTFDGPRLLAVDRMVVNDLAVDQTTGAVAGQGPGWMRTVRFGDVSVLESPMPGGPATATRPAAREADEEQLTFLHVDFQRGIEGNLHRRRMTFLDQVETTYGPVETWDEVIDAGTPEGLGPSGVFMRCDRLSVTDMAAGSGTSRAIELEALGNTMVEGRTFLARAHRITYAQAKDLLVLEGDGRSDAQLWRQTSVGGPRTHAAARKVLYWRSANRVEVDDATHLDLGQLRAMSGGR